MDVSSGWTHKLFDSANTDVVARLSNCLNSLWNSALRDPLGPLEWPGDHTLDQEVRAGLQELVQGLRLRSVRVKEVQALYEGLVVALCPLSSNFACFPECSTTTRSASRARC